MNELYSGCPQPSLMSGQGVTGMPCDCHKEHSSQEDSMATGVNKGRRSNTDQTGGQERHSMASWCHGRAEGDELVETKAHRDACLLVILRGTGAGKARRGH